MRRQRRQPPRDSAAVYEGGERDGWSLPGSATSRPGATRTMRSSAMPPASSSTVVGVVSAARADDRDPLAAVVLGPVEVASTGAGDVGAEPGDEHDVDRLVLEQREAVGHVRAFTAGSESPPVEAAVNAVGMAAAPPACAPPSLTVDERRARRAPCDLADVRALETSRWLR